MKSFLFGLLLALALAGVWFMIGWAAREAWGQAPAPPPISLGELQATICEHETLGSPWPDAEVGAAGEIGRCQVKPATARMYGFRGPPTLLFFAPANEAWAQVILMGCVHHGKRTVFALAYCYNAGHRARVRRGSSAWAYAATIDLRIKARRMADLKRQHLTARRG